MNAPPRCAIDLRDVPEAVRSVSGIAPPAQILEGILSTGLIPLFRRGDSTYVLARDIAAFVSVLSEQAQGSAVGIPGDTLFPDIMPRRLPLGHSTWLTIIDPRSPDDPAYFSASRNLMERMAHLDGRASGDFAILPFFGGASVFTACPAVSHVIEEQQARAHLASKTEAARFANSAYYMGSKRLLGGFLVEALASVLDPGSVVLDVMCGSGAAAAAFNKVWETHVSDALRFCQLLGVVQGGGFTENDANRVLEAILPIARAHASQLRGPLEGLVAYEDSLFHRELDEELVAEYARYVNGVPTFPGEGTYGNWNPAMEVRLRRSDPAREPFCLFTAYFANVYFGLRQCMEIDSLRFAIERLGSTKERDWALGALIASVSALGTTYGGHFAQPIARDAARLSVRRVGELMELRARSIIHEFSVRFRCLAQESERSARSISATAGPWRTALSTWRCEVGERGGLVYLDAPYKREEYSRYYHVLETLVRYGYPSSVGVGRMPNRSAGELFRSEFFTRKRSQVERAFVEIVGEALASGWCCAWSYSDSGDANMMSVIEEVCTSSDAAVRSFAAPYEHKAQGGRRAKRVTEYAVIFEPRSRR